MPMSCSITVQNGFVRSAVLRPAASGASATGLGADLLEALEITIGIVARQSALEGRATEDGAGLTVSARMVKCSVSMGGDPVYDRSNTKGFLALDGEKITLNPKAPAGATAKIGVQNTDGTWKTLTFTKEDQQKIRVTFRSRDSLR